MRYMEIVLLLLLLSATPAFGQKTTLTDRSANCTASDSQLLAANNARNMLILINDSDTTVYVMFGTTAVVNKGLRLNASGGAAIFDVKYPVASIRCIHGSSGNKKLIILEGTTVTD